MVTLQSITFCYSVKGAAACLLATILCTCVEETISSTITIICIELRHLAKIKILSLDIFVEKLKLFLKRK